MSRRGFRFFFLGIPLVCLFSVLFYFLPPVHERLAWRVDNVRAQIKYALHPPEEAIFIPQEIESIVQATLRALTPSASPTQPATKTPTPPEPDAGPTETPAPSFTPTVTPTPLPESVVLDGVKYEDQHGRWNYCGPSNLSMALTYWGWDGNRDVVGAYVKPEDKDRNVMPYEMQDFVETQTGDMSALIRYGGDIDLIKQMIAGGFPVLVEKGYYEYDYTGKLGWMGHYQFVNGYDDAEGVLTVQDTYIKDGKDHKVSYAEFLQGWRSFDYIFLIVYPKSRQPDVLALLGPYVDPAWASNHALEVAMAESQNLDGIDEFFAWFNRGTSHVNLQDYSSAATEFDYAFQLYANLTDDDTTRPYRMMWYQTWPYWAYYYTGRYQDVINLADTTLEETISEPVLEESFYWRALAREALGDQKGAIKDLKESVQLNPHFTAGKEQLARLDGG